MLKTTRASRSGVGAPILNYSMFIHWGVILGVRAQGVALSPNQPLNYRAQGFWPVTFGLDYTVNYPDFRVRGASETHPSEHNPSRTTTRL